ncbi:PE-PPE domain-containing protein [Mycolicibacterium vaccae]|uniref:PE-PPE domain-containing protein n=1 Tax=Mycolicibacterium vaccae TaxID=1810 RepID=UPI003CFA1258
MSKFSGAAVGMSALTVAAVVAAGAVTQPMPVTSSQPVDPTALIVVGSSTRPNPSGNENFFGGLFNQAPYNPGGSAGPGLVGVNFRGSTAGIRNALLAHPDEPNAVLSSGWGAANASLVLSGLDRAGSPVLPNTLFILDNNVSRPDGGFGTRYPLFALIGVNPFPSPVDTSAAGVVDIAYQYNYNSNAPADLLNLVAHVNSLVAYLYDYRDQTQIDLPVDVEGRPTVECGSANTCAVLVTGTDPLPCPDARCDAPDGDRIAAYVTTRGNTTYVTYTTDELPLTRLIRRVLGDAVADVSAPLLKLIVDSAYYDGNPIPSDPSRYRPARLMPSLGELVQTAVQVPGAVREGLDALSDRDSDRSPAEERSTRETALVAAVTEDDVPAEDPESDVVEDEQPATEPEAAESGTSAEADSTASGSEPKRDSSPRERRAAKARTAR